MDAWREIRRKARRSHADATASGSGATAADLVATGLRDADLEISHFAPGTIYGKGVLGALEREDGFVRLSSELDPARAAVVAAHEIGHFWLHDEPAFMIRSTEAGFGGQPIETGADRVVAYSPRERREVQADVFAQEFLLPADRLRERLLGGRRPSEIAEEMGLPREFVRMQALRALLLPPLPPPGETEEPPVAVPLDPEQREAAEWDDRPLILDAGPGTGKTRTLVARIRYLVERGEPPASIVALTYSNKAAGEMIERIERLHLEGSALLWLGTFHAFGLELLRLHSEAAGLPEGFSVLDEPTALAMLEGMLPELALDRFQNLWDPTIELRPVLRAISRAKDEMVSPAEYEEAARAALGASRTEEQAERAEKAVEVGRIYGAYQAALERNGCVDFGDLVWKAAALLRDDAAVRAAVRARHRHVLVDEYQDVNHASTALLDQLADRGRNVWVVADPRQSIYRFRGAAPANAARFADRHDRAERRRLKTNYRSGAPIVSLFQRYGAGIAAAPRPAAVWAAHRGTVGFVEHVNAPDLHSEASALRDQVERLRRDGIPYEDQAILARTHLCLARFGRILGDLGVPVLYLGDLFERPEIRDLLALISLGADPSGVGLVRVARFAEYGATRADTLLVIDAARREGEDVVTACARAATLEGISERGREALLLLHRHLAGVGRETTAWSLLSEYLLETSGYLRPFVTSSGVEESQSLIAIYQFLKFAREDHDANRGRGGRRNLLEAVRRLERLDDDRQFRFVPPEAEGLPAVRMMTVHAAKGLEFRAVHLPQVATRYLPAPKRPVSCPAPIGLERLEVSREEHDAEEECLFFVALSRARDVLTVSSARTYTGNQNCNPSKHLDGLSGVLPPARPAPSVWPPSRPVILSPPPARAEHESRHLDLYLKCPLRYRHEVVDQLYGTAEQGAYLRFHGCVRRTLFSVWEMHRACEPVTREVAVAALRADWALRGPVGHPLEAVYLVEAERMVATASSIPPRGVELEREWTMPIDGHTVGVRPDRVFRTASESIVAQVLRTGRQAKGEAKKPVWSVLAAAGRNAYPGQEIHLEAFYPARGLAVPIQPTDDRAAFDGYRKALASIARGEFEPLPSRDCPTCPYYFVCTSEDR